MRTLRIALWLAGLSVAGVAEGRAASLLLAIDPVRSELSISAEVSFALQPGTVQVSGASQAGSLGGVAGAVLPSGVLSDGTRTSLSGQILVDLTPTSIRFRTGLTSIQADASGSWLPGVPGASGQAADAELALRFTDAASGLDLVAALRDTTLTQFSALLPLTADASGASFDASLLFVQAATGGLDYTEALTSSAGRAFLWAVAMQNAAGAGRIELGPGTLTTLTLPIDVAIVLDPSFWNGLPLTATLHLTGNLIATAGVPEPDAALLLAIVAALGIALASRGRSRGDKKAAVLHGAIAFVLMAACGPATQIPYAEPTAVEIQDADVQTSIGGDLDEDSLESGEDALVLESAAVEPSTGGSDRVQVSVAAQPEEPSVPPADGEEEAAIRVVFFDAGNSTPMEADVNATFRVPFAPPTTLPHGKQTLRIVPVIGTVTASADATISCPSGSAGALALDTADPQLVASVLRWETGAVFGVGPAGETCTATVVVNAFPTGPGRHEIVIQWTPYDVSDVGLVDTVCDAGEQIGPFGECRDGRADLLLPDFADSRDDCAVGAAFASTNQCAGVAGASCDPGLGNLDCNASLFCDEDQQCSPEQCGNGSDDDGDQQVDCLDSSCDHSGLCAPPVPPLESRFVVFEPPYFHPFTTQYTAAYDLDGSFGSSPQYTWSGPNCGWAGGFPLISPLYLGSPVPPATPGVMYWIHPSPDPFRYPNTTADNCTHPGTDHDDATVCVAITDGGIGAGCSFLGSATGTGPACFSFDPAQGLPPACGPLIPSSGTVIQP